MKTYLKVEEDRIRSHQDKSANTVHRSSLLAPRIKAATTNICFLNHFYLKRGYKNVSLKITPVKADGSVSNSLTLQINEPIVYSLNLDELFLDDPAISLYVLEFFSEKNFFIPFPAVMINHIGGNFTNSVHAYNRILNDIFEDESINAIQVEESSIDCVIDDEYDTFFNYVTGPVVSDEDIKIHARSSSSNVTVTVKPDIPRLTNKTFLLSDHVKSSVADFIGSTVSIKQPKQKLFYGRLLCGIVEKNSGAFSANHSFYNSNNAREYFDIGISSRNYPYFEGCLNRIRVYPIMSPSVVSLWLEVRHAGRVFASERKPLESPGLGIVEFDVDSFVESLAVKNVTSFQVMAEASDGRIPTRMNHQLVYGASGGRSKLHSSINVSLRNERMFHPAGKTGLCWGQVLVSNEYDSKVAFCFNSQDGESDEVVVSFYGPNGLLKEFRRLAEPNGSLIFDAANLSDGSAGFIWYFATSKRADLSAYSIHSHKLSCHASGEHSF